MTSKFEQLIEYVINDDEQKARELFHNIVVEKSREIYEGMMDQEGGLGGQVGDFQDEIASEEQGMTEEDEDGFGDLGDEGDEEEISLDGDEEDFGGEEGDFGAEGGEEGLEDRVVSLEDKLDELMAEFEELMADEEGEEEHAGGFGDEEGDGSIEGDDDMDMGDEEGDEFGAPDEEEAMMEAVQLKQVGGSTYNKFGTMGDNGAQTKSPALTKPKVVSTGAKPVNVTGSAESVPTSPKAPSNYGTKGETSVKGAGNFKNSPGQNAGKTSFKEKVSGGFGTKTPQGKEVGSGGSVSQNDKSIVGESRRTRK